MQIGEGGGERRARSQKSIAKAASAQRFNSSGQKYSEPKKAETILLAR